MRWTIVVVVLLSTLATASAQTDRASRTNGKVVSGKIEKVVRQGISIRSGGKTENIPSGGLTKILHQGDPPGLTKGREFALDGQYEEAIEELKTVDLDDLPRELIRADAQFYLVYCQGRLALSGRADRVAVIKAAQDFARKNPQNWHFYDAVELLGDLAIAVGDHDRALAYYKSMESAPLSTSKIKAKYLIGRAKLAKGDVAGAVKDLKLVNGVDVGSTEGARLKTLAQAQLAVATARSGDRDAALKLADGLISGLDTLDVDLAARVYNARGAVFEALDDNEGAVLAYLHTDLMFASVADAHAVALSRLAELWTKVGKADRAAKTNQELKRQYPGYGR